ncbi:hypothetical protein SMC26_09770 [Actinomadura fulvescens]|uniref:Sulfotransferase family protein n=1 Tax=Actinomadura fulvescens TaxID=46160 RepID=A0ABN3Q4J7_9ACTN
MAPIPDPARSVVYLHVGSPKSGTTFLQQILWRNRAELGRAGVLLPARSFQGQQRAVWDLRDLEQHPADPAPPWTGLWDRLAQQVLKSPQPTAIVSHETLASLDERQIKRAVEAFHPAEVHVVYTMRDLAGLLPSEWQEYVKHRCLLDYEAWISEVIDGGPEVGVGQWFWRVHDAPEVLRRWSTAVPAERIHLITVPPPGAPRDLLWRRFADLVGVSPDEVDLDQAFSNSSLGFVEAELLRRVNAAVDPETPQWLYSIAVKGAYAHEVLSLRKGRKVYFPSDRRDWVDRRQLEMIESLRAGGYDMIGDLDELVGRAPHGHAKDMATHDELLDAAAGSTLALLDEIYRLRGEVAQLRGEIAKDRTKPLYKTVVEHFSETNPTVMKARVAYWHAVERVRGTNGTSASEAHKPRPSLWSGAKWPKGSGPA